MRGASEAARSRGLSAGVDYLLGSSAGFTYVSWKGP